MEPIVVRLSDSVTIINADCRDMLPVKCDAVVTDPPYGIYDRGGKWGHKAELQWDKEAADVLHLLDLAECVVIWGGNYFPLPPSRGWLSWFKPDRVPSAADVELCWTSRDMNARQISHSIAATNGERVGHPTQKPVRVMVWCMEQTSVPTGAIVLDPFAGSGSTGIACIRTGRKFIGIERDSGHFATMRKRLEKELEQGLLPLTYNPGAVPLPAVTYGAGFFGADDRAKKS
jgi:site-specific DNA-methyltransferase (adenine-specific)/modification methylase